MTVVVVEYKRKCENWLDDFMRWNLPRCEAQESFIFWAGIITLSGAVRRHIFIPKKFMGSYEIYPNLYVMFVAPAGERKSTTVNYLEELLDFIPDITKSPELITKEKLLTRLVKSDDKSMLIRAPEFGEFMMKSGLDMYGWLTNMYDGKRKIEADTIGRGAELAESPCVNLIGATTPEWIAENMPPFVFGGGYASRVIHIYEETVRRRKLYYTDVDMAGLDSIKDNLLADVDHISRNLHGEFTIENDARDWMENYYSKNASAPVDSDPKLRGYYARKPTTIHKVAMLIRISYSDTLTLTLADFQEAIKQLDYVEKKLHLVFQGVGKNPYTLDTKKIYDFIREKGRVKPVAVLRKFYHVAQRPDDVKNILKAMIDMESIDMIIDEKGDDWLEVRKYNGAKLSTKIVDEKAADLKLPQPIFKYDPRSLALH